MLPTGKVMVWQSWQTSSAIWDPGTGVFEDADFPSVNIFCSAHTWLPDGRLFVVGGQRPSGSLWGEPAADIYDPYSGKWASQDPAVPDVPTMNLGRWYPSATTMGNGDVLVTSGYFAPSPFPDNLNPLPQVYEYETNQWRDLTNATRTLPEYPRTFLAPDGRAVVLSDFSGESHYLDVSGTGAWEFLDHNLDPGLRDYSSSVMYDAGKVAIFGGGGSPTDKVNLLDLNDTSPQWAYGTDAMDQPRRQNNATILADGTVLITGGTSNQNNDPAGSVTVAEIFDPVTQQVTQVAAASNIYRGYHSTAILLPDGSVLVAGGEHDHNQAGPFVQNYDAEIYEPAYMHRGPRPTIATAPDAVSYGETFFVETPNAADIERALMVVPGSTTHSQNWAQRANRLEVTQASDGVFITLTENANEAPPGMYMLFLIDDQGIPSVAEFVRAEFDVILGDFTGPAGVPDGVWDCFDINALTTAIASQSNNVVFDMTGDGQLTMADITDPVLGWLAIAGGEGPGTPGGQPYLIGDADLNGVVDGQDFILWNNHKFTSTSEWCAGDFNADGVVDGQDFIAWNNNKFSSSGAMARVPEPLMSGWIAALVTAWFSLSRRRDRQP
ncbi:MAG: galactose oxidase-like domain-containing protein, partial [Planctomycetota bacterium]